MPNMFVCVCEVNNYTFCLVVFVVLGDFLFVLTLGCCCKIASV